MFDLTVEMIDKEMHKTQRQSEREEEDGSAFFCIQIFYTALSLHNTANII